MFQKMQAPVKLFTEQDFQGEVILLDSIGQHDVKALTFRSLNCPYNISMTLYKEDMNHNLCLLVFDFNAWKGEISDCSHSYDAWTRISDRTHVFLNFEKLTRVDLMCLGSLETVARQSCLRQREPPVENYEPNSSNCKQFLSNPRQPWANVFRDVQQTSEDVSYSVRRNIFIVLCFLLGLGVVWLSLLKIKRMRRLAVD